ncbi:MAG: Asp23/Gls24 family envelope stress response protein [Coriobacteriales bacterium]|nr:Asp23/Gls24 family envelope stress response protein [Coriobacteriales bacterium]
MDGELVISGIGVSRGVVSTIVAMAAERVEGVASVGDKAIASGLISAFTAKSASNEPAVSSDVEDDKLLVSVRLSVFYGYPFTKLAADVRSAIAEAVSSQMGFSVGRVDVCIDNLVFPKE